MERLIEKISRTIYHDKFLCGHILTTYMNREFFGVISDTSVNHYFKKRELPKTKVVVQMDY